MTTPYDPWRAEVCRQARIAIEVATQRRTAAERTLGYYLRRALADGLPMDEVCAASGLDRAAVLAATDPHGETA